MATSPHGISRGYITHRRTFTAAVQAAMLLAGAALSGCAALTNPLVDGIPVNRLPPEILGDTKDDKKTIPLTLLRQQPPDVYRLAPGDVLGVYIEGVLPATVPGQTPPAPPVHIPAQINVLGRRLPPAVGYPFPVQENGVVALPLLDPVLVRGKTLAEAEKIIRDLYVERQILKPGRPILVTLMQQRQHRVTVIRQEAGGFTPGAFVNVATSTSKRGTGSVVDLPAYENDVLSAVAQTGGLPGLDAYNEIIIFKGGQLDPELVQKLEALPRGSSLACLRGGGGAHVIEIPLRMPLGEKPHIRPEDVLLETGDVVFVEARDSEKFYTGGILPAGEFDLPRDYDLPVIKAISLVKGSLFNGAFGGSNLSGALLPPGVGNPSPSLLTVVRRTPDGSQVPIRVDLNRAIRDARENILVKPGDVLILQEKPSEALARYFTETFFNFNLSWQAIHSRFATGIINIQAPERR